MPESDFSFHCGRPRADLEREALDLAFQSLPPAQRKKAIAELCQAVARGERSLAGLHCAFQRDQVVGAVFVETYPGNSATLWPPRLADAAAQSLAEELLSRAVAWLEAHEVEMVQCVLATDSSEDARRLRQAGFGHPCDLLCLVSEFGQFPTSPVAAALTFERITPHDVDDVAALVERTYEHTLDCPALDAARDCRKVLAGYRATCRNDLSHWFVVREGQQRLGCLLLGHDAQGKTWELVYMGLVPAARGRGWGLEIVRQAQWLVRQRSGERLVLAVDAANQPALGIYAAAGFTAWDRRSVFVKMLSPTHK